VWFRHKLCGTIFTFGVVCCHKGVGHTGLADGAFVRFVVCVVVLFWITCMLSCCGAWGAMRGYYTIFVIYSGGVLICCINSLILTSPE